MKVTNKQIYALICISFVGNWKSFCSWNSKGTLNWSIYRIQLYGVKCILHFQWVHDQIRAFSTKNNQKNKTPFNFNDCQITATTRIMFFFCLHSSYLFNLFIIFTNRFFIHFVCFWVIPLFCFVCFAYLVTRCKYMNESLFGKRMKGRNHIII